MAVVPIQEHFLSPLLLRRAARQSMLHLPNRLAAAAASGGARVVGLTPSQQVGGTTTVAAEVTCISNLYLVDQVRLRYGSTGYAY